MKAFGKYRCVVFIGLWSICVAAFGGEAPRLAPEPQWLQAPQTWPAPEYDSVLGAYPHVQALYYAGPPWKGKETRAFAFLGMPDIPEGKRVPGMVLVHGGGGTAFAEWVAQWVERGYAAIAMDYNGTRPDPEHLDDSGGGTKISHDFSGPGAWGFDGLEGPMEDYWLYHAVAAVLSGHSLLRSQSGVDPERIGLTGISWGGFLTCLMSGLDGRFAASAPVYGCGFIWKNSAWQKPYDVLPEESRRRWAEVYDPSVYLPRATLPMLWVNGTNDFAYWMENWQASYRLVQGPVTLALQVERPHSHPHGWAPPEIAAFFQAQFENAPGLPRILECTEKDGQTLLRFSSDRAIARADLHYTLDNGPSPDRKWHSEEAVLEADAGAASARLAEGATLYFMTLTTADGLTVSSEHRTTPAYVPPAE